MKQHIKEKLEARLMERLDDPEVTDSTLKIALDYLKVFKVDDAGEEVSFRVPRKGVLKEFANQIPGGSA